MVPPPYFLPRRPFAEPSASGAPMCRPGRGPLFSGLDRRGFTLVETVLALGIAMLFLAAIFTVLSVGLTTSQDASDDTTIGLILQETASRVRGTSLAPAPGAPLKFYFDNRGRFVDQNTDDPSKNFFVAVATPAALNSAPQNANLLAVVVKVYSRVDPVKEAAIPSSATPKATFSLLKTTTSGKGWTKLDPSYQPKIDL